MTYKQKFINAINKSKKNIDITDDIQFFKNKQSKNIIDYIIINLLTLSINNNYEFHCQRCIDKNIDINEINLSLFDDYIHKIDYDFNFYIFNHNNTNIENEYEHIASSFKFNMGEIDTYNHNLCCISNNQYADIYTNDFWKTNSKPIPHNELCDLILDTYDVIIENIHILKANVIQYYHVKNFVTLMKESNKPTDIIHRMSCIATYACSIDKSIKIESLNNIRKQNEYINYSK